MKNAIQKSWEDLAQLDPKWAILTAPDKKYNKWSEKEFFETGEREIQKFLAEIKKLGITIEFKEVLDFGCGIGRLTKALAKYFDKVYGVDISQTMISLAKKLNQEHKNIIFVQNNRDDLSCFENNKFDLIYSVITLQHLPKQKIIKNYLQEFIRILKPGGFLYFQLPTAPGYSWLKSILLKIRGQIYCLLAKVGFSKKFCFLYLRLAPYIPMNHLPTDEINNIFSKKANILHIYNQGDYDQTYLIQKV